MRVSNAKRPTDFARERRYVQGNQLSSLEGLGSVPQLRVLNFSNNKLTTLDGIAACPLLTTLLCANNQLDSLASLEPISACAALETLDVQSNKLSDPEVLGFDLKRAKTLASGSPLLHFLQGHIVTHSVNGPS